MQSQTYITLLKEQHLDEATRVLAKSFLQLNSMWKNYKPKYEQIFPILRGKILATIQSNWSFVLIKDQKVIGVSVQYELLDYLEDPSMPTKSELFKKLSHIGSKLQQKVDFSNIKRGQSIYGLYAVIDPQFANKGYSQKFWWHSLAMGKICGWNYYYSRISSQVSLKILLKFGAQIISQYQQENQKFWMIRLDLTKPYPSLSVLKGITNQKRTPSL